MSDAIVMSPPEGAGLDRVALTEGALQVESEQRRLLHEYVAKHMRRDTDYGVVPGTKKPSLLKPGAERLTNLFHCVADFEVVERVEDWDRGLFAYEIRCEIRTRAGAVLAVGLGSCSTYESKYRWRQGERMCPDCGETVRRSKKEFYCWTKTNGCGQVFDLQDERITSQQVGRVQNPDICDQRNTALKMAKKRAHVDAALNLGCCSDIFTQDVEDMPGMQQQRPQSEPPPAQQQRSAPDAGGGSTFRFGRLKGKPLAGAPKGDLEWYYGAINKGLDDPDKARFRDENVALLKEITLLLATSKSETVQEVLDSEDDPFGGAPPPTDEDDYAPTGENAPWR